MAPANPLQDSGGGTGPGPDLPPVAVLRQDFTGDGGFERVIADPDASPESAAGGPGMVQIIWPGTDGIAMSVIVGRASGGRFGHAVSATMDFNFDGSVDLLVGAPGDGAGHAYLFLGPLAPHLTADHADLVLKSFFARGSRFGERVGPITDFDGDGLPDIRVSERIVAADGIERSRTWIFSSATGFPIRYYLDESSERMWDHVSGDLDGDGDVDDFDLILLAGRLGLTGEELTTRDGDLDGDGVVGANDLAVQMKSMGGDLFGGEAQAAGFGGGLCDCLDLAPGLCCINQTTGETCCGAFCGDGICEGNEDFTCPDDCTSHTFCGNGICDGGENANTCPVDCGPACGNGVCEQGEGGLNGTCPGDCPQVIECGNGECEEGETAANCPEDCAPPCAQFVGVEDDDGSYKCVGDQVCFTIQSGGAGVGACPPPTLAIGGTASGCLTAPNPPPLGEPICLTLCAPGTLTISLTHGGCEDCTAINQQITVNVVEVDLDVDSDNTNSIEPPERSPEEDAMEDDPALPGKYIAVNRDNDDDPDLYYESDTIHERIDDFGDGYDRDGIANNEDDVNPDEDDFIPLIVEIKGPIEGGAATVRFEYSASDPAALAFEDVGNVSVNRRVVTPAPGLPGQGVIRIWDRAGSQARSAAPINAATPGNYIAPGIDYPLFAFQTQTLYIEGIAGGEVTIQVSLDPDGPQGPAGACNDTVRLTVVDVVFSAVQPNSGFDHTINPRGLMVPVMGENALNVSVAGAPVKLRSTVVERAIAEFDALPIGVTEQVVKNQHNEPAARGPALIEAYMDTPDQLLINQLRVYVLKEVEITVATLLIVHNGPQSVITEGDAHEIVDFMNGIWISQANIRLQKFAVFYNAAVVQGVDLGDVLHWGVLDAQGNCVWTGGEMEMVWNAIPQPREELNLMFFPDIEAGCSGDVHFDTDGLTVPPPYGLLFGDDVMTEGASNAARGRVFAHEFGHFLSFRGEPNEPQGNKHYAHDPGIGPGDYMVESKNLMQPAFATAANRHITLRQAVIVNVARDQEIPTP